MLLSLHKLYTNNEISKTEIGEKYYLLLQQEKQSTYV